MNTIDEMLYNKAVTLSIESASGPVTMWLDRLRSYIAQGYILASVTSDIEAAMADPSRGLLLTALLTLPQTEPVIISANIAAPTATDLTPISPEAAAPSAPIEPVAVGKSGNLSIPDEPLPSTVLPTALVVTGDYGANVRDKPTLEGSQVLVRLPQGASALVNGSQIDAAGFTWYSVSTQQTSAPQEWVRADNVRTNLEPMPTVSSPSRRFALPTSGTMTTPYDPSGSSIGYAHNGWDYANSIGTPIMASAPGSVVKVAYCTECGAQGASSVDRGYPRGSSAILNNPAWNYGYGHYVIVRYDWDTLPSATKDWLKGRGWANAHAFVMYAHLSQIKVQFGATLTAGQAVGLMGNSGNSTGSHLHLEVRYSSDTAANWSKFVSRVADPATLFDR